MNDISTLSASVNLVAGSVTLSWDVRHLTSVDGRTINSVRISRTLFGSEAETIVATTFGDFAGSTYTDTPPARGQYRYKIVVVAGTAPELTEYESNSVGVSTTSAILLTGSVVNGSVNLSWTAGVGAVVSTTVERSADGGLTYFPVRHVSGNNGNTFSETVGSGTFIYRVRVVLPPATCDATGQNPILVSNVLGVADVPPGSIFAPSPDGVGGIDLGLAGFAILAGSTVTNTGGTVITGNLGLSPGTSVTGFPPGTVSGAQHVADVAAANAQLALTAAYNDAAGRINPSIVAGNIGGQTLPPGVYKSTSSLAVTSGNLTLDAGGNTNAVWIFQVASTLDIANSVILAGGANSSNVFWQVGTSATIGVGAVMVGTIMADQSITLATGASLLGRALARIGAVTLDTNAVTIL